MNNNAVQQRVVQGPLTSFQLAAIAVCIGLNMLDGFDVLAMSFSASGVKAEWGLQHSQLGYLLSAGLVGMALGRPDIRTVCLIGDGSAMYSIQALWTAAQRKLPLTVVVINNAGYGAMRSFSQVMQVRNVPGLDLPGIDFVKLAEGMGCDAVRVTRSSELKPALKRGLAHGGTSLIEVMVDSAVPMLYAQRG